MTVARCHQCGTPTTSPYQDDRCFLCTRCWARVSAKTSAAYDRACKALRRQRRQATEAQLDALVCRVVAAYATAKEEAAATQGG